MIDWLYRRRDSRSFWIGRGTPDRKIPFRSTKTESATDLEAFCSENGASSFATVDDDSALAVTGPAGAIVWPVAAIYDRATTHP